LLNYRKLVFDLRSVFDTIAGLYGFVVPAVILYGMVHASQLLRDAHVAQ
jgi:hypothetical protein